MSYQQTQQETFFSAKIFAVFLLMFGYVGISQAITIDFTGTATGSGTTTNDPYSEDGFTLETPIGTEQLRAYGPSNINYRGSDALFNTFTDGTSLLRRSDNGLFDLLSIDLAAGSDGTTSFNLGFTPNGGSSQNISFNLENATSFHTFDLSSFNFTNLTQITWQYNTSNTRPQFDNIGVNAVPIPAAVWLLGSGLLGLVSFKRKR